MSQVCTSSNRDSHCGLIIQPALAPISTNLGARGACVNSQSCMQAVVAAQRVRLL
jgi:hypothetical protein